MLEVLENDESNSQWYVQQLNSYLNVILKLGIEHLSALSLCV